MGQVLFGCVRLADLQPLSWGHQPKSADYQPFSANINRTRRTSTAYGKHRPKSAAHQPLTENINRTSRTSTKRLFTKPYLSITIFARPSSSAKICFATTSGPFKRDGSDTCVELFQNGVFIPPM